MSTVFIEIEKLTSTKQHIGSCIVLGSGTVFHATIYNVSYSIFIIRPFLSGFWPLHTNKMADIKIASILIGILLISTMTAEGHFRYGKRGEHRRHLAKSMRAMKSKLLDMATRRATEEMSADAAEPESSADEAGRKFARSQTESSIGAVIKKLKALHGADWKETVAAMQKMPQANNDNGIKQGINDVVPELQAMIKDSADETRDSAGESVNNGSMSYAERLEENLNAAEKCVQQCYKKVDTV